MYLKLIRNKPQGNAITGRLIIDGRWFCNTLERKGYEILALCYHVAVTMSPKFKRLLPLVTGVPRSIVQNGVAVVQDGVELSSAEKTMLHNATQPLHNSTPPQGRTAAEVEQELTRLILKAQNDHEEIILEVIDYRPDTDAGYDTACPIELQQHKIDERRAAKRLSQLFREFASDTQRPST